MEQAEVEDAEAEAERDEEEDIDIRDRRPPFESVFRCRSSL